MSTRQNTCITPSSPPHQRINHTGKLMISFPECVSHATILSVARQKPRVHRHMLSVEINRFETDVHCENLTNAQTATLFRNSQYKAQPTTSSGAYINETGLHLHPTQPLLHSIRRLVENTKLATENVTYINRKAVRTFFQPMVSAFSRKSRRVIMRPYFLMIPCCEPEHLQMPAVQVS